LWEIRNRIVAKKLAKAMEYTIKTRGWRNLPLKNL
jgi:hypothetical protein